MKMTVIEQDGYRHVMVQGEQLTNDEESRLLTLMTTPSSLPVELRLYDMKWISAQLTTALNNLLETHSRNKVYLYKNHLFTYLSSLGIPVRFSPRQEPSAAARPPFRALVLGGSADSLHKILLLMESLPLGNVTVFIVQHVSEDKPNLLDELLRQRTPYTILMPHHMTPVATKTIYVAPPGHHMRVAHGLVYLTRDEKINTARPSIDVLFESVAREYGPAALGVLLCGWNHDGVAGAKWLIELGGEVLILTPDDCPNAKVLVATAQKEVEGGLVVPLEVATSLTATAATEDQPIEDQPVNLFFAAVERLYGSDYRNYQPDLLKRRLNIAHQALGISGRYACQREILTNLSAYERLFLELSINVTAFFRMPVQFKLLHEEILPYLESFPRIKIWVAGCSSGEEVYSLAILLHEMGLYERCMIYATDINPFILMQARNGLYPWQALESSRANYTTAGGSATLNDYCTPGQERFFSIRPDLRRHILFYRHSLAGDGPFNEFQLIVCRNTLIYFNNTLKSEVMELFANSLHQDGILLLGEKEAMTHESNKLSFVPWKKGLTAYTHRSRTALHHDA